VCTKQDQEREKSIQLPVSHALSDHHICHGVRPLVHHVKHWSFSSSSMNCMSIDSNIEVFYHLNKLLIATKHTADNFVFSKTEHWHILHVTLSKPFDFTFSNLWPQQPKYIWWTSLIIRFRESYNSMSMSFESTSLKKSSGDWLKLAKQRYSIWVKWCYFWTTANILPGSAEALVRYGGVDSICWLFTFSVTHYENTTMLSRVTAKHVGDVFWDTVQ